jgi:hypothetical protein
MKAVEFCYWLQGYFELFNRGNAGLNREQIGQVKAHLALVFKHDIDPSYSVDPKTQADMQKIHDAGKTPPPEQDAGGCSHDVVYRC